MNPIVVFFLFCFACIAFGVWGLCKAIGDAKRKQSGGKS